MMNETEELMISLFIMVITVSFVLLFTVRVLNMLKTDHVCWLCGEKWNRSGKEDCPKCGMKQDVKI